MEKFVPVITKQYSRKVNIKDIVYIQQQQRRLAIVTDDETFICYERMDNIMENLDDRFFRVMKKLTINLEKVVMAKDQRLFFENGTSVYLGKENFVKTKQKFAGYLRKL